MSFQPASEAFAILHILTQQSLLFLFIIWKKSETPTPCNDDNKRSPFYNYYYYGTSKRTYNTRSTASFSLLKSSEDEKNSPHNNDMIEVMSGVNDGLLDIFVLWPCRWLLRKNFGGSRAVLYYSRTWLIAKRERRKTHTVVILSQRRSSALTTNRSSYM